jgi:hypothetical protein
MDTTIAGDDAGRNSVMTPAVEAARSELIERMMLTDPSYDASFDHCCCTARR